MLEWFGDSPDIEPSCRNVLTWLYLAGLIHANHGLKVMDYLSQEIKASESEVGVVRDG